MPKQFVVKDNSSGEGGLGHGALPPTSTQLHELWWLTVANLTLLLFPFPPVAAPSSLFCTILPRVTELIAFH